MEQTMGLDFYAGSAHDGIAHHEEHLLGLAVADAARWPQLHRIRQQLYDNPRITAPQAGELVHELLDLLHAHGGIDNRPLAHLVLRLMLFFSTAARAGQDIQGHSD